MIQTENIEAHLSQFAKKAEISIDMLIAKTLSDNFEINIDSLINLLQVALSIIRPPDDLQGILRGESVFIELLNQALNESHDLTDEDRKGNIAICRSLFRELELSSRKGHFQKDVRIENSPVFMFHILASETQGKKHDGRIL